MNWIDECINGYYRWLRDRTEAAIDPQTGWAMISTPFPALFGDTVNIYIKKEGNKYLLSDDGETVSNLQNIGIDIVRSQKKKTWRDEMLVNYGLVVNGDELTITANKDNLFQKKHSLMCAISDLYSLAATAGNGQGTIFKKLVRQDLDAEKIIYTPQFIMRGGTGIQFTFDFQIAGRAKELVIKSFNSLNSLNVPNFLFAWDDIRGIREKETGKQLKGLAFINDEGQGIKNEYLSALQSKGAEYILWSERNNPSNREKILEIA